MASDPAQPITVTAFGKHPAWADHIDNLPNPGPRLPHFKSLLYTNGIDANVRRWVRAVEADPDTDVHSPVLDSDRDDPEGGLIRFGHRVRWWNPDALIIGRMIPSSDLKQRKKYPLVIVMQCVGVQEPWLRRYAWPTLERLCEQCPAAASVDEVRGLLNSAMDRQDDDQGQANPDTADDNSAAVGAASLQALCDAFRKEESTDGDPPIEVMRLLYQIQRFTGGTPRAEDWGGTHLRVPALSDNPLSDMVLYEHVARHMTADRASVLTVCPVDRPWIDLVLGDPGPSGFECLRRSNLPYCTEIAYNLEADERFTLAEFINGTPPLRPAKEPISGIFKRLDKRPEKAGNASAITSGVLPEIGPETSHATSADLDAPAASARSSGDRRIQLMLLTIGGLLLIIILLVIGLFKGS